MASRRVAPIPPKGNEKPLNVLLSALRTSKDEKEKKHLRQKVSDIIDIFIETGKKGKRKSKRKGKKQNKTKSKSKKNNRKSKRKRRNKTKRKQRKQRK